MVNQHLRRAMVKLSFLSLAAAALYLVLFALENSYGQEIKEMKFINQPVTDILLTLAEITGKSIVPDNTVRGNASYYFLNTTFDKALKQFLDLYNLYFWKEDDIYYVSRFLVIFDRKESKLTVRAKDVPLKVILERISKEIKTSIIHDALPGGNITINSESMDVFEVIKMIMHRFPDYTVESTGTYFYIRKVKESESGTAVPSSAEMITETNGLYSIKAPSIRLENAVKRLFTLSGFEYSMFMRGNTLLKNLYFKNKSFAELLGIILESANGDYTLNNGIYYLFDISRNEVLKKMNTMDYIHLDSLPVEIIPSLLPSGISGSASIKIDKENNGVIVSGSRTETTPLKDFIVSIEKEYEKRHTKKIILSSIKIDELIQRLPPRLKKIQMTRTGSQRELVLEASENQIRDFVSFVKLIDTREISSPVHLRYIRAEDLLKNMPPSIDKTSLIKSSDPNLLFFTGSSNQKTLFLKELRLLDKPVPQIKYDLLVIQYQLGKKNDFNFSIKNDVIKSGGSTSILGALGNLLNINFDIVSTFGYSFALSLNAKIGNSQARILADTTLNGLTGEDLGFQNTNTYRYRDLEIDPDSGKILPTGVTREITSGIIIHINGWVSGNEMITMKITSTVSKRGADISSNSGNPPPTSEKVINTHVRTPSGRPVIIGGLIQQERDVSIQKTPLLGDIPLIGWLFTSRMETMENTELVIYIVPRIEYPDMEKTSYGEFFKSCYRDFFMGGNVWN